MSSYFYQHIEKNILNAELLDKLEHYSNSQKLNIYVLDKPLTDQKYSYEYSDALILLIPRHKIIFVNYGHGEDDFEDYVDDIIEDIGSISDKYLYKKTIGRPKRWRGALVEEEIILNQIDDIDSLFNKTKLDNEVNIKKLDLLISLFIGSINNIDRVKDSIPETLLDKIKQKIQLFDGDQTRFIYDKPDKKIIRIQGLSGTGKTELLLHKLKDLYINNKDASIFFTCHNKVLADSLKKRIPLFFNFMKVEQQIEWESRLWCTNAWGANALINSGAYRYIAVYPKNRTIS